MSSARRLKTMFPRSHTSTVLRPRRSRAAQMRVTRTNSNSSPGNASSQFRGVLGPNSARRLPSGSRTSRPELPLPLLRQPGSRGRRAGRGVTPSERRPPVLTPPLPSHPPFPFHPSPPPSPSLTARELPSRAQPWEEEAV
ncbi:uncharacterized protein [Physeter macrocephalus]|uniref:Uncharacterized protein n=1 Tax=Physeter macrocephalus TaxID=9755 RepID=A0A455BIN6_PHYMC|nr:uncharacterized protein LOC114486708 [Physeter catodon]|eukprot:XP_028348689.1 leucine-rich repeat extensin-like protein 5 [Physeter catodon]